MTSCLATDQGNRAGTRGSGRSSGACGGDTDKCVARGPGGQTQPPCAEVWGRRGITGGRATNWGCCWRCVWAGRAGETPCPHPALHGDSCRAKGDTGTLGSLLVVVGPCSSWSLPLHQRLDVPALSAAWDLAKQSWRQPSHPVPQFPHLSPRSSGGWLGGISPASPLPLGARGEAPVWDRCP